MTRDLTAVALTVLALLTILGWWLRPAPPLTPVQLGLQGVMGEAPEGFRRVTEPQPLHFPDDHAAHPAYRNEWWYFTGNLTDEHGRDFGYQFTLFRFALAPLETDPDAAPPDPNDWASDSLWMGHLALSDAGTPTETPQFHQAERFARGALGLAGATTERWWLRDWRVDATERGWTLQAEADGFALALTLEATKPIVLQGDKGYSRKGPEPGNASRYYSITRLHTHGQVQIDTQQFDATGLSWLDREWGSGQLSDSQSGWDWFALHLDDGRDLMVYQLRDLDGLPSAFSAGMLVASDGTSQALTGDDFNLTPLRHWTDQAGVRWPLDWHVTVPEHGLDLHTRARFDDQRWWGSVPYWEGMIEVLDATSTQRLGLGYLELSGYATVP